MTDTFPAACPSCRKPTTDLIANTDTRPKGAGVVGRHCYRDDMAKWRAHCLVIICVCGAQYTNYPHHYGVTK